MKNKNQLRKHNSKSYVFILMLAMTVLTGCFKDYKKDFLFKDFQIEFDIASRESNAPDKTYPILPTFEKGSGIHTFQVNLIGGQKPTDQILRFRIVADESTAIEGVNYSLIDDGVFTIPADSSFGYISINILDFKATFGTASLVLELIGNEEVKVAENYKRIGLSISLTGPPAQNSPLYEQLGSNHFYNTIAVDIMQPGLSQDFMDKWTQMKANLFGYGSGGRTPYNIQLRFGDDNQIKLTLIYTTTVGLSFAYAYASWIYKFEPNAQGVGRFEFVEGTNINATNLYNGVMAPLLVDYFEKYEFRADWVPTSVSTPRPGAQIGGFFRTDDPGSHVFGELTYIEFDSNTPRPMPTSPAIYNLFDNGGSRYSSIYIDPDNPAQSQDFKTRWADGKAAILARPGNREPLQLLMVFDEQFNDVIVVNSYTKTTSPNSKFIGQTRYWLRMSHSGDMKLDYIDRNANAGVTTASQVFTDYLDSEIFTVTRNGNNLIFTSKDDPSSFFIGSLGELPISSGSFLWPF